MAIANGVLAPLGGTITDRYHPRAVVGFGFSLLAVALTWLSFEMSAGVATWRLVLPLGVVGVAMAFGWQALAATATRNLPSHLAGAGSAVYNSVRQLGAVVGSAGMAAFMTWRIGAEKPPYTIDPEDMAGLQLPKFMLEPFSAAMAQSMLLPGFVALFGIVAALFLLGVAPPATSLASARPDPPGAGDDDLVADDDFDDDHYVELILLRPQSDGSPEAETDTAPIPTLRRPPSATPIRPARNGFHVDTDRRFSWFTDMSVPTAPSAPREPGRIITPRVNVIARQGFTAAPSSDGRHRRHCDPDDSPTGYGRH